MAAARAVAVCLQMGRADVNRCLPRLSCGAPLLLCGLAGLLLALLDAPVPDWRRSSCCWEGSAAAEASADEGTVDRSLQIRAGACCACLPQPAAAHSAPHRAIEDSWEG